MKSSFIGICLLWCLSNGEKFYEYDDEKICRFAPSASQIEQFEAQCPDSEPLRRPLEGIRKCCETDGLLRTQCLEDLRSRELHISKLFLKWREPQEMDAKYREHIGKCKASYKGIAGAHSINLLKIFESNCTDGVDSKNCASYFPLHAKRRAFDSICVNDYKNFHTKATSVHYLCWKEQSLSESSTALNRLASMFDQECEKKNYGIDMNVEAQHQREIYEGLGQLEMWETKLTKGLRGILDYHDVNAESYLDTVCDTSIESERAHHCMDSPVTQSHLTFRKVDRLGRQIDGCCSDVAAIGDTEAKRRELRACLEKKHLYEQLYPVGGLYMRGLMRFRQGKRWECESHAMLGEGYMPSYWKLPREYREKFYTLVASPTELEESMELNSTLAPEDYFFFLRGFGTHPNEKDGFFRAACEACSLGDKLGKGAFIYPGLMCPALVADALYKKHRFDEVCPQKQFYKFQVANYCCLQTAVYTYNLDKNFDPKKCPAV